MNNKNKIFKINFFFNDEYQNFRNKLFIKFLLLTILKKLL